MSIEFERKENTPFEVDESRSRRHPHEDGCDAKGFVLRFVISLLLGTLLAATLAWTYLYTIAHGASDGMRERLVREAHAADADWIPALVLPASEIDEILGREAD